MVSISLGAIMLQVKAKRELNVFSFATYIVGFSLFLASLLFLLRVIWS